MNYFRRPNWRDNETQVLLKSWKEHAYMDELTKKGSKQNILFPAIMQDLEKAGIHRDTRAIMTKLRNLARIYYHTSQLPLADKTSHFKWYNEVEEIMTILKKNPHKERKADKPEIDQARELLNGPCLEENAPLSIQRKEIRDPKDGGSYSNQLSITVIKHIEPKVPKKRRVIEVHLPASQSITSNKTTENILLNFYHELRNSNRELETNDAAILELFKEQNDIFREQTTLMQKLLLK